MTDNIKYRHAVYCYWADKEYGRRVTVAMGLAINKVMELAQLDPYGLTAATVSAYSCPR